MLALMLIGVMAVSSPAEEEVLQGSDAAPSIETAVIDHLQLKDIEMIDVLKLLSDKSGLNIIAGKDVKGKVSMYLNRIKLKDALTTILDSNNLAYKEKDGIIFVMTSPEFERRYGSVFGGKFETKLFHLRHAKARDAAPVLDQAKSPAGKVTADETSNTLLVTDTAEKLEMMAGLLDKMDVAVLVEVFELSYASAKDLAGKIEPFLTRGAGSVRYDERSNTIVIAETEEKMHEVYKVVKAFDVREEQVLIEAKIVQIELTDDYELGVDWEAVFTGFKDLDLNVDFDIVDATETNKGSITVGTIARDHYSVMLEALQKIGNTNVLSSPSITALSNQEAKILVGSTQPYVTTTTTTPSSGPTTTAETINFIDVGVKLYVTPVVHKDGFITMKIRPEVSSVLDSLETSGGNNVPIVKTSEAETMVRIKDGVTIVIGGLIEDSTIDTRSKVPLLGDIPLLGLAFRNQSTSKVKTEIAIFLTPKIISGEEGLQPEETLSMAGTSTQ